MIARLSSAFLLWIPAAAAAPRTFAIDGNKSSASAHVGKTGIGSFAGHEHTVVARTIQGEVVLDLEERGELLTAAGKMVVKQTDFGIEPTTAAGGLVRVEDEVVLTFRIEARAAKH
jgi:polyisoprenoid-binding protein YceI